MRALPYRKLRITEDATSTAIQRDPAPAIKHLAGRAMKWSVWMLTMSLKSDATDPYDMPVPDGVADFSDSVTPLVGLGSTGHIVNEFEEYNLGRHVGDILQRLLPVSRPTKSDLLRAILGLVILYISTLRAAVRIKPDLTINEILSEACSPENIRNLQDEFKVVPVRETPDGDVRPMFGIMTIFSRPIPRTIESALGPAIRKLGKLDFFIRKELGELHPDTGEDVEDFDDDEWDEDESTEDDE
jgi:hypothetical protein